MNRHGLSCGYSLHAVVYMKVTKWYSFRTFFNGNKKQRNQEKIFYI